MQINRGATIQLALLAWAIAAGGLGAASVTLKSGAQYEGNVSRIGSVLDNPLAPPANVERRPVVVIEDEGRFTCLPFHQTSNFVETAPRTLERIRIDQIVASAGRRIGLIGDAVNISPFDERGRRVYSMRTEAGVLHVYQGITEITPTFTKVEGLRVESPCIWDMRIATTSIPPATLSKVLMQAQGAGRKDSDARLRVVRLLIQMERYRDALEELAAVLRDFPELAHLKDQQLRLVQLMAQQVLRDLELRRDAGQHLRVMAMLENFPNQDVAAETLLRVRDMLKEFDDRKQQYDRTLEYLDRHLGELKDAALRSRLAPACEELKKELNLHTLNRMADYLRLADDDTMAPDQKLALALSGWFLGTGSGIENVAVAASLSEVRDLVLKYLRSELLNEREDVLARIKTLEGGTPSYVAKLIAHMKPPLETQAEELGSPGLYEVKVKGIDEEPEFSYLVQLPPEYNPWKRYPCIVTLNGGGSTELQQIGWWAGDYVERSAMRTGQAARHGYVVIAPKWQRPLQAEYEYSLREHAAVLFSLRDACRRISIDTDRVFLSGHFVGGDAAWDIALAHPDLWAGCVMFAPRADRYVRFYRDNARMVPLYFVGGEKDAGTAEDGSWLLENSTELDRYLSDTKTDCTLVMFRGRGRDRDGFSDEIQRIFQWMGLPGRRRNPAPEKIEVVSLRPWDNYFWWLECDNFPASATVFPSAWPQPGARAARTEAEVISKNGRIRVNPSSSRVTVWLSPEIVDLDQPVQVAISGRELKQEVKSSVDVILEDVRTRGDRQHPFWALVEWPERRQR
jgi:hypothetical protein